LKEKVIEVGEDEDKKEDKKERENVSYNSQMQANV